MILKPFRQILGTQVHVCPHDGVEMVGTNKYWHSPTVQTLVQNIAEAVAKVCLTGKTGRQVSSGPGDRYISIGR